MEGAMHEYQQKMPICTQYAKYNQQGLDYGATDQWAPNKATNLYSHIKTENI